MSADVCVVGGGPTGIVLARELGAAGLEVLLVERGELERNAPPADPDTAVNVGIPYHLAESRLFEFGGATQRWRVATPFGRGFGRLRELEDIDFERRPWIPHSGWPFAKAHLGPFYRRARALFECPWPSEAPEDTWDHELHQSPFTNGAGQLQARTFYFVNPAVFSADLKRDLLSSEQVLVLTNSVVVGIRCDESPSSVSALTVATAPDHIFTVEARAYVLAAGGIENPRLLLASRSRYPNGLGNSHDLVGRFFMEHPHYASGRLIPRTLEAFHEPTNYDIHLRSGIPIQKKYALADEVVRNEGLTGCVFRFDAKPVTESIQTLRYGRSTIRSLEAAGKVRRAIAGRQWSSDTTRDLAAAIFGAHRIARLAGARVLIQAGQKLRLARYTQPQMFWIRAMAEQVPNPDSRVRLSESRDRLGVPLASLDWRLTEQDLSSIQRSQELLGKALLRAGHRSVESLLDGKTLPPALSGGRHHMGTTRMHASPRDGVVDPNCRVHEVANLYVAGSSVFPTVGYANPTLTHLALAFRLADHLKSQLLHG